MAGMLWRRVKVMGMRIKDRGCYDDDTYKGVWWWKLPILLEIHLMKGKVVQGTRGHNSIHGRGGALTEEHQLEGKPHGREKHRELTPLAIPQMACSVDAAHDTCTF